MVNPLLRLARALIGPPHPPTRVVEDPDDLGYFVSNHPFVEDVTGSAKCPDTIPDWMMEAAS